MREYTFQEVVYELMRLKAEEDIQSYLDAGKGAVQLHEGTHIARRVGAPDSSADLYAFKLGITIANPLINPHDHKHFRIAPDDVTAKWYISDK